MPVSLYAQYKDLETGAAKQNPAIIHFIIYTCAFPTVTCQTVFSEKCPLVGEVNMINAFWHFSFLPVCLGPDSDLYLLNFPLKILFQIFGKHPRNISHVAF